MLLADLLKDYLGPNFNYWLLAIVASILAAGVLASWLRARHDEKRGSGT